MHHLPPVGMKVHVNGIQNVNTLPYEVKAGDVMFKVVKTLVSYNMSKSSLEIILLNSFPGLPHFRGNKIP